MSSDCCIWMTEYIEYCAVFTLHVVTSVISDDVNNHLGDIHDEIKR